MIVTIGLLPLVFVTFLVLKLTDVIDWSWWWVTAPLWGAFVVAFIAGLPAAIKAEKYRKEFTREFDKKFRGR